MIKSIIVILATLFLSSCASRPERKLMRNCDFIKQNIFDCEVIENG